MSARSWRWSAAAALAGALAALPYDASAQGAPGAAAPREREPERAEAPSGALPSRVRLVLPECASLPFSRDALEAVLRVELRQDGVREVSRGAPPAATSGAASGASAEASLATISLGVERCGEDVTAVLLRIDDEATGKHLERLLDLSDIEPATRARTLALAVAETLRSSWAELLLRDAAPVPPALAPLARAVWLRLRLRAREDAPTPPPAVPPAPPPRDGPAYALSLAALARSYATEQTGGPGAVASVYAPLAGRGLVGLRAGVAGVYLRANDRLGVIVLASASAQLAPVLGVSAGPLRCEVGPRVELGWTWAWGEPGRAGVLARAGSAPLLTAGLAVDARLRLLGALHATAGFALSGVALGLEARSEGVRAGGAQGVQLDAALGVAYAP